MGRDANILAIDAGNTNTVIGHFEKGKLKRVWRLPSKPSGIADFLSQVSSLSKITAKLEGCIIASVVPSLRSALLRLGRKLSPSQIYWVGLNTHLKIPIRVKHPEKVGIDRIVNAVAAHAEYSAKNRKTPLLIIDFGTATTFDAVTAHGEFLGGAITPGLHTINKALAEKCEQLPLVPPRRPRSSIGKDTHEAIQSGVFLGYVSLVEGMIQKIGHQLPQKPTVILTGGISSVLSREIKTAKTDPYLTLKGLYRIYQDQIY